VHRNLINWRIGWEYTNAVALLFIYRQHLKENDRCVWFFVYQNRFVIFNTFPVYTGATESVYTLLVPLFFWIGWNVVCVGIAAAFTAFGEV